MHTRLKSLIIMFYAFAFILGQGVFFSPSLEGSGSIIAERGGGRGGSFHAAPHEEHFDRQAHPNVESHPNYHPAEHYNPADHNLNIDHYNQFDRNAWHDPAWNAGWGGALDVVPEGEYVYPTTTAPASTNSGDMNTLYDTESTNPTTPQN